MNDLLRELQEDGYSVVSSGDGKRRLPLREYLKRSDSIDVPLLPKVHWVPSTNDNGAVRWGLEYTVAKIGGVFGPTTTVYMTQQVNNAAGEHLTVTAAVPDAIQLAAPILHASIRCRLFRDGGNAADTYPGKALFISACLAEQGA